MVPDPVAILQVYAERYRTGKIAPHRNPVRARTVKDSLRAIGQTFAGMWADDPCLNRHGTDFSCAPDDDFPVLKGKVTFEDIEDAKKAVAQYNGMDMGMGTALELTSV